MLEQRKAGWPVLFHYFADIESAFVAWVVTSMFIMTSSNDVQTVLLVGFPWSCLSHFKYIY